jgi:hypothetical protein
MRLARIWIGNAGGDFLTMSRVMDGRLIFDLKSAGMWKPLISCKKGNRGAL